MTGYLLDTNHLTSAVKPQSPIRKRIQAARSRGARVGVCVPVLCELQVGAQLRIWPLDRETARHYGEIFLDLRRRGRVLSQVDMMQAALARQMDLVLLTADRDFEALQGIATENWLLA